MSIPQNMNNSILEQIKALQHTNRQEAEVLTLRFLREVYAEDVSHVELRPLAVSLNSFNGFLTRASGKRLFFKTHTEENTVIQEYYQAALLADAGYPVIQPVFRSAQPGKQLLIYEVIDDPSVFDAAWAIETGRSDALAALTAAQHAADDLLLERYLATLALQESETAARAPIHQLFYHRLAGERLTNFYGSAAGQLQKDPQIQLPGGTEVMSRVRQVRWTINGQQYETTLNDLIARALVLLHPAQTAPSVIGHGDAHNGNVFFRQNNGTLVYFDPAFAGQHSPLLDLAKPLFHNVFAMWMYYPREKQQILRITREVDGDHWIITHDYTLHPVRMMFLQSKFARVLAPLLRHLAQRGELRTDWREYLKAALFCCPFLTLNLTDASRFPPEISLLGLCMAVEMGAESSRKHSLIDRTFDEVAELAGISHS